MKLHLSIEFESLEEYRQFSDVLTALKPSQVSKSPKCNEEATLKISKEQSNSKSEEYPIKGFWAPKGMLERLNKCITNGKPFKTGDIAGEEAIRNPHRRSKINKWLQGHPALTFHYEKIGNNPGGRGVLIYTPVHLKILPAGAKPRKSDWPIKGASIRKSFVPVDIRDDEEFTISEASNN